MVEVQDKNNTERPPSLGGGPLGFGDPNDKRLRKAEENVIIPKMILEEAEKKCSGPLKIFLECSKNAGFLLPFKCKEENNLKNECIASWTKNSELIKETKEKYLAARSHYRKTGETLLKYVRSKKTLATDKEQL